MSLTFTSFLESYTNYHSFVDLLNLCKEVRDHIYNKDITNSQFFDGFKETSDGYAILFNKSGQKNYYINIKKQKITDENGDEQVIDKVYEDIETLYSLLQNDEMLVNIKQMDEKMKTFEELINDRFDYNFILELLEDNYGTEGEMYNYVKNNGFKKFEEFEKSKYFFNPIDDEDYSKKMFRWLEKVRIYGSKFASGEIEESEEMNDGTDDWKFYGEGNENIIKTFDDVINEDDDIKTFSGLFPVMNEGFEEDLKPKLSEKYISLKRGILELLDSHLKSDVTKLQDFISNYVDPDSEEIIEGLVEDADIFDFYLKYQSDIDQILLDNRYYDDSPDVESLYDYVIDGTFDAVVYCLENMQLELYGEEE